MAIPLPEVEKVLKDFLSDVDHIRNAAEEKILSLRSSPERLVRSLIQALRSSEFPEARNAAAILLRRSFTMEDGELVDRLSPPAAEATKSELLASLTTEKLQFIRRAVCDTISEFCRTFLAEHDWPELLKFIFEHAKSDSFPDQELAFMLMERLTFYLMHLKKNFPDFERMFGQCLSNAKAPPDLKAQIVRSFATLICSLEKAYEAEGFQSLSKLVFDALNQFLSSNDEENAAMVLSVLIDMAIVHPSFFKSALQNVITAQLTIANDKRLPDALRRLALEFVVSLAEKLPAPLRKTSWFLPGVMPVVMGFILEQPHDDPEWVNRTEDQEAKGLNNRAVGEESLDRLAEAIGGKHLLPRLQPIVAKFLEHEDWRYRYAALSAIVQTVEVFPRERATYRSLMQQIKPTLRVRMPPLYPCNTTVTLIRLPVIPCPSQDKDPRVRYACMSAVTMLGHYQEPGFQLHAHDLVSGGAAHCCGTACKSSLLLAANRLPP